MIRIKGFILIVFLAVIYINGSAQNSQVMYYMRIPQNHFNNPAFKPANSFYIGLPVLTNINAGIKNNFLKLTDLFAKSDTISSWPPPNFDLNKLAGTLKENNSISAAANIQLLGLSFMIGQDLNIFIDVIDRIEAQTVFPKDIMKLYITGYDQFLNRTISLSGLNFRAQYFREYGLGFSKNLTEKLRVGAKVKLLSGIASISLDNRVLSLKVNSINFSQEINADATLDISGKNKMHAIFYDNNIFKYPSDSAKSSANIKGFINDYIFIPLSNTGVGFDFGAVFNVNKMISISASVTDLGFIKWKDNLKSYKANDTFVLRGLTLKDVVEGRISADSLYKNIKSSIVNSFKDTIPSAFKTYLFTGINVGANLNLLPILSFGVLSNSKIYSGQVKEALTLSANSYFGRAFSASLSYTIANYSYNNFGFGMAFQAGPAQIYLIADKIPTKWSKLYIENNNDKYYGLPMPQNWNMLNLQLGLNISFGKIVNKKVDKPMLTEQK